jgi:hypothetical protein
MRQVPVAVKFRCVQVLIPAVRSITQRMLLTQACCDIDRIAYYIDPIPSTFGTWGHRQEEKRKQPGLAIRALIVIR